MSIIFIVAGTAEEAETWMLNNNLKHGDMYIKVDTVEDVDRYLNPHGVFVGTWRDRKDILEILELLNKNSLMNNMKLQQTYEQLKYDFYYF